MAAAEILIVDDEADIRDLVAGILEDEGYATRTARNSDEALAAIVTRRPSLALLDIWLQGSTLDGLQLLDAVKQEHPDLPVVMISGHGNIETAVAAIKQGAYDFIENPSRPIASCWWWNVRSSICVCAARSNSCGRWRRRPQCWSANRPR
jgi:two-component system, NtrC family, nitrogen regulation response regulator NtrX